jgi:hypothetical protein
MAYNLDSPSGIAEPCDFTDLEGWLDRETFQLHGEHLRKVVKEVGRNVNEFVKWPSRALLLWQGCDRIVLEGQRQRYHAYPPQIKVLARERGLVLDGRANGPAIAAYLFAGGQRPERLGSSNAWSVHHLYSGKFPYLGRASTTHACKDCNHFTQSAGLVGVHPIADAMADEFPFFTWFLRAQAFMRFGYDPDGAFSSNRDPLGFVNGRSCEVLLAAA